MLGSRPERSPTTASSAGRPGLLDDRRPFDPSRLRFYYGWIVLAAGTVGVIASVPGQTAGVSMFTDHLVDATGQSRLELSTAYLIGTGASGFLLPRGGLLIDRHGARRVALGAVVVHGRHPGGPEPGRPDGASQRAGRPGRRLRLPAVLGPGAADAVVPHDDRHLVRAAPGAGHVAVQRGDELRLLPDPGAGFRTAWRAVATAATDRRPPDGPGGHRPRTGPGPRRRDLRFWAITVPPVAMATTSTALTFHIVDFGQEAGLSEAAVVAIFLPIALVSVPVTLTGGWMIDTLPPLVVAAVMSLAQIVMSLAVPHLDSPVLAVAAIAGWGPPRAASPRSPRPPSPGSSAGSTSAPSTACR